MSENLHRARSAAPIWRLFVILLFCSGPALAAPPAPGTNLLTNPGFDLIQQLNGWGGANAAKTWSSLDEFADPASGSLLTTVPSSFGNAALATTQCVPITGGQNYRAAISTYVAGGQTTGSAYARILFYSDSGCATTPIEGLPIGTSSLLDSWDLLQGIFAAPVSAAGAKLFLGCLKNSPAGSGDFQCHHDNGFLPEPSQGVLGGCALGTLCLLGLVRRRAGPSRYLGE